MFSFCVLVSDKVPPPLPPSTIVEWNPALRPGQLGNEVNRDFKIQRRDGYKNVA